MENNKFGLQPPPSAPPPEYQGYFVPNNATNYPQNYEHNFPNQGHVVHQVYSTPTVVVAEPKRCWDRERQNKRQSKVVAGAFMILISGGMNIAASILSSTHMRVSWFVGALIGALLAAILANKIPKKLLVQFASILVIIGGVIVNATRLKLDAIFASRYLDGIANGLVVPLVLTLTGEIVVKNNRGSVASTEQVSFSGGIFLQYMFGSLLGYYGSFSAIQLQGICSILYGTIALIMSSFLMVESPVTLLTKQREQDAIDILRRMQQPQVLNSQTYEILDEHKRYLAENSELSFGQSATQGTPALIRLCLYRALNAMSMSLVVAFSLHVSALMSYKTQSAWPFIVFSGLRFMGSFIPAFIIDSFGRKKLMLIGSLICGVMAFCVAVGFTNVYNRNIETLAFLFVFQFFAGLASTSSSAYLTEAFPLAVKNYFISAAFMVEMLVQLIISTFVYSREIVIVYFYILGTAWILYFLLGIWCLPETKQTTLREAQQKFKGFISKGF